MKNKIIVALIGLVSFVGCQQNDDLPLKGDNATILDEVAFLKNEGIITQENYDKIISMKNLPIKWGDNHDELYPLSLDGSCSEMISRKHVQSLMSEKNDNMQSRHRRHLNMFSSSGGTIVLSVQGISSCGGVTSEWVTAINQAITAWNNLGYKVKFAGSTATTCSDLIGYINVTMGNTGLGSSNIAATILPTSSGAFGTNIMINTAYTGTALIPSAKLFAITHELGHAIGLLHTDTSEGYDVYSTISCGGTTGYTDSNSIMKKVIPYNQLWTGFTICDKNVINYYW